MDRKNESFPKKNGTCAVGEIRKKRNENSAETRGELNSERGVNDRKESSREDMSEAGHSLSDRDLNKLDNVITGSCQNVQFKIKILPSSSYSCLSLEIIQLLGFSDRIRKDDERIKEIQKMTNVPILGEVFVILQINGFVVGHNFFVHEKTHFPCIVGSDFLEQNSAVIDFTNRTLIVKDNAIPMLNEIKECGLSNGAGVPRMIEHLISLPPLRIGIEVLSSENERKFWLIMRTFADVFSKGQYDVGDADFPPMKINLKEGAVTFREIPHFMNGRKRRDCKEHLKHLVRAGIIRPSRSPWASRVAFIRKKGYTTLMCIDFSRLNKMTIKDKYPLPTPEDLFDHLGGNRIFSIINLASSYHHVKIREADKPKTAFLTPYGLFEFNRLPYGLANAAAYFTYLMNDFVLIDMRSFSLNFLGNIIVFSENVSDHLIALEKLFRRLNEFNLKIKSSKCEFVKPSVKFLGHMISVDGIEMDKDRLELIRKVKLPKSHSSLISSIGVCGYYRKFIKDFAEIASPLYNLIKNHVETARLVWPQEAKLSFYMLKERILSFPVLKFPNFDEKFHLITTCSDNSLSAVLKQEFKDDQDGKMKLFPVCYASKTLSFRENKLSLYQRESLAACWGIQRYQNYLKNVPFYLYTDIYDLSRIFRERSDHRIENKWTSILSQYDFTIRHVPNSHERVNMQETCHSYLEGRFSHIVDFETEYDKKSKEDKEIQCKIIKDVSYDAYRYNCRLFHESGLLETTNAPNQTFELISVDFIGPLNSSGDRFQYVMMIMDLFSHLTHLYPIKKIETSEIVSNLVEKYFSLFGLPRKILIGYSINLNSTEFENFLALFDIQQIRIGNERNKIVEYKKNEIISEILNITKEAKDEQIWLRTLYLVQNVVNKRRIPNKFISPHEIVFGRINRHLTDMNQNLPESLLDKVSSNKENLELMMRYSRDLNHYRK